MTEVFYGKIGRKKLSSKSTVTLLGRFRGFREKGNWLSMVAFSLVEDGADCCFGDTDHKRQLGIGTGDANVAPWARQDFKRSMAANYSVDISMGPFRPPVRGVRDPATAAQFGMKR